MSRYNTLKKELTKKLPSVLVNEVLSFYGDPLLVWRKNNFDELMYELLNGTLMRDLSLLHKELIDKLSHKEYCFKCRAYKNIVEYHKVSIPHKKQKKYNTCYDCRNYERVERLRKNINYYKDQLTFNSKNIVEFRVPCDLRYLVERYLKNTNYIIDEYVKRHTLRTIIFK